MKLVNLQKCGCFKNLILLKQYQATNLLGDNIYTVYMFARNGNTEHVK